ncbi:MAG: ArsR family transcriptional regulator [Deltaproteobacteria bacterium]|nr:ArsR family transcriptional regulator [Deltaproteobacteria bacterium]
MKRIDAEEARAEAQAGSALLVCSYNDGTCKEMLFEGAMLRSTFESKVPSLPKDQKIIFYCN